MPQPPAHRQQLRRFVDSVWETKRIPNAQFEVFALGYKAKRLTVHAQQKRALNLAALITPRPRNRMQDPKLRARLRNISDICVIGGGIAGMTFAAAAALQGKKVTLLERHTELLNLQRGNHTRWLHPNIYDWPDEKAEQRAAELPLLTWSDGLAGDVAQTILDQWNELIDVDKLKIDLFRNVDRILYRGRKLVFYSDSGMHSCKVDAVVLATGSGVEALVDKKPVVSYWKDDPIHQLAAVEHAGEERPILVAGTGDGGLIDALRLCLRDFNHEAMLSTFHLTESDSPELIDALRKIKEARPPGKHLDWPFNQYELLDDRAKKEIKSASPLAAGDRNAKLAAQLKAIDARLDAHRRGDTKVTLLGKGEYPFDSSSSMLNSFLVWRLCKRGGLRFARGELVPQWTEEKGGWAVSIKFKPAGHGEDVRTQLFDHVVVRFGPPPPNSPFERCFSEIHDSAKNRRKGDFSQRCERRALDDVPDLFCGADFPRLNRSIVNKERAEDWLGALGLEKTSRRLWNHKISRYGVNRRFKARNDRGWNSGSLEGAFFAASECRYVALVGHIGSGKTNLCVRFVADQEGRAILLDYGATVRAEARPNPESTPATDVADHFRRWLKSLSGRPVPDFVIVDGLDFYASYRSNAVPKKAEELLRDEIRKINGVLKALAPRAKLVITIDCFEGLERKRRTAGRERQKERQASREKKLQDDHEEESVHDRFLKAIDKALGKKNAVHFQTLIEIPNDKKEPSALVADSKRLSYAESLAGAGTSLHAKLSSQRREILQKLGYRKHRLLKSLECHRQLRACLLGLVKLKDQRADRALTLLLEQVRDLLNFEISWDDWTLFYDDAVNSADILIGWQVLHRSMLTSETHIASFANSGVLANVVSVLAPTGGLKGPRAWPHRNRKKYVGCDLRGANFGGNFLGIEFSHCNLSGTIFAETKNYRAFHHCSYALERPPLPRGFAEKSNGAIVARPEVPVGKNHA